MSLTELHLLDGQTAEVRDIDRVRTWPARFLLLLLLGGAVFFALRAFRLPVPLGAIAPPDQFSAVRALRHVEAIREAAPGGVEGYLAAQLAALGLAPEAPVPGSRSVAGRLPGTEPTGAILLLTAYDPAGSAPGAAGAAMVLEALRTFGTEPRPKNDVIVLFSAARPLDEASIAARRVALVIRFERLSDRGPVALVGTSRENGWLLREALRDLPHPAVFLESNDVAGRRAADGSAWLSFAAIGGPTAAGAAPDARTLQGGGEAALALLRRFGSLSLPGPRTPDLVAFNVGPDQVVSYPATWSRAGGILAAAAAALLLALGVSHRRLEIESFTSGVVFFPLVIALAAAVAAAGLALLVRWNPGGHALPWGTPHSAWFSGGVLALAVAVAAALGVVLRARRGAAQADPGLAAAGLLWWTILAVVTGFRFPDLAVLAVVPSLLLVPAFLVLFLTGDPSRHPWLQALALALAAVPAALLLTPVWRLLDVAAGWAAPAPRLSLVAVSAGLGALAAATLLPHLSLPRRRWLFPVFCLLAAAGLLVAGARLTP
jgi:hypothetical protein